MTYFFKSSLLHSQIEMRWNSTTSDMMIQQHRPFLVGSILLCWPNRFSWFGARMANIRSKLLDFRKSARGGCEDNIRCFSVLHSFAPSLLSYLSLFSVLHLSSLKAEMMECILSLEPYTIFFALQPQYWGTSSFPWNRISLLYISSGDLEVTIDVENAILLFLNFVFSIFYFCFPGVLC